MIFWKYADPRADLLPFFLAFCRLPVYHYVVNIAAASVDPSIRSLHPGVFRRTFYPATAYFVNIA